MPAFREAVALTVWEKDGEGWRCREAPLEVVEEGDEADYAACVLGLRDYVAKNRFPGVVLGLFQAASTRRSAPRSRSTRSVPTGCIASCCPTATPRTESLSDAAECAERLGVRYDTVPISGPVEGFEAALKPLFSGARDITEENLQAHPRHDPDVDLEQVRADGGDDRQQIRDVGRLRDALRRHERRLQPGEGPLQDGGLPALSPAQRWKPAGALGPDGVAIPENIIAKAPTASCARTRRTRTRCRPTTSSTTSSNASSSARCGSARWWRAANNLETVKKIERLLYLAEYKRRQRRRASR